MSRHFAPQDFRQPPHWLVERAEFVVANTHLTATPHVPEILLYLGDDAVRLWGRLDSHLGVHTTSPPYWAFAWAGGQALARHVLDHPEIVTGRRVLDFAAGSGIAAIAAAKAGAAAVTASETDPFAALAVAINSGSNDVRIAATEADLLSEHAPFDASDFDVVLAGDIFYDPAFSAAALSFLWKCQAAGAIVLIGDPGRTLLPRPHLVKQAEHAVAVSKTLQYSAADAGERDVRTATVWKLCPNGIDEFRPQPPTVTCGYTSLNAHDTGLATGDRALPA